MRSSSLALAALASLAAACGSSAPSVIKTSSSPQLPSWITKAPPRGGGDMYFVGATTNADSLDDGKSAALNKARGQAAEYLGVRITASQNVVDSTNVAEQTNTDSVKARAEALIRGATIEDVYYERLSRQAGATSIDRYDVWVLAKLSRAELDTEKQRQSSEAKISLQNGIAWLREGQQLERGGQIVEALVRYRKAEAAAGTTTASTDTGDAQLPNAGRLHQVAAEAARAAQAKARRAILVGSPAAMTALSQALAKKGFTTRFGMDEGAALQTARSDGTPWVIVATEQHTAGGRVFQQVAASVALDVRALDAKSGAVVATSQKQAKEVARTPEAAAAAAAREAGSSAGKELAVQLVDKESAAQ